MPTTRSCLGLVEIEFFVVVEFNLACYPNHCCLIFTIAFVLTFQALVMIVLSNLWDVIDIFEQVECFTDCASSGLFLLAVIEDQWGVSHLEDHRILESVLDFLFIKPTFSYGRCSDL